MRGFTRAAIRGITMKLLWKTVVRSSCLLVVGSVTSVICTGVYAANGPVLAKFKTITQVSSTVPANGDVNPYGMAQVRYTTGNLRSGHILVSNFNNANNLQGTGTTIVDVAPDGTFSLFASIDAAALPGSCPGGVGLTTALVVLNEGWVIVGSLPTSDGTSATAQAGCLIVLNSMGKVVETFSGSMINGPWDMTATERGHRAKLFVTNVLNGTLAANGQVVNGGTVLRVNLRVSSAEAPSIDSMTVIASGFPERTDPAALVIGPTGVALSPSCDDDTAGCDDEDEGTVLYVADTLGNRVARIEHPLGRTSSAGSGQTLSSGGTLNGPLGLTTTPNGHVLTVNSGDGNITEITPRGQQVASAQLDGTGGPPPGAGTLFGLVFDPNHGVYFVDDGSNTLNLFH